MRPILNIRSLLIVLVGIGASAQTAPDAKDILSRIDHNGPARVLRELTAGDESPWNTVLGNIDTGAPDWLEVARRLLPVSDGGHALGLHIALATALTSNPTGVLELIGPSLSVEQVCTVPFIEPDKRTVAEYKTKVTTAVSKVNEQSLSLKKQGCLQEVAK